MHTLFSFWAKLGNVTWPDQYHPVLCHLIDVAVVVSNLWERVFRSRKREWIGNHLGLDSQACGKWLAFWCGAHDIGKVAYCFQHRGERTLAIHNRLRETGYDSPIGDKPHAVLSTVILNDELCKGESLQ